MIQILTEQHRSEVQTLLNHAPELNLYMLGNIDALGIGTGSNDSVSQYWGDFCQRGSELHLRAVMNRYMSGWNVWGTADADWAALAQVLDHHPVPAERIQDNPSGVPSFLPYLQTYTATSVKVEELMKLNASEFRPAPPPMGALIRRATQNDLGALIEFYADAEQMARSPAAVERPLNDTRIWVAVWQKRILAAALTNAETQSLAMIGGVYTKPSARGYGLSQAVCSALCAEILAQRKLPVLYWETPAAGRIYHKLGFKAIGSWRSVRLARVQELVLA